MIISELVKQEGIDAWQAYLKELIMWINSEDIVRIGAGLEFLCLLFSTNESKNGLHVLVPELLPVLFQVFTIPEVNINFSPLMTFDILVARETKRKTLNVGLFSSRFICMG